MELLAWISGLATGVAIMVLIDFWRSAQRKRRARKVLALFAKSVLNDPYEVHYNDSGVFVTQNEIERRIGRDRDAAH